MLANLDKGQQAGKHTTTNGHRIGVPAWRNPEQKRDSLYHQRLTWYQRGLDTLTLPSQIKRFPPILQRDFLSHDFVYFNPAVIEIIEGPFE
jgi:hypothetical protein